MKKAVFFDIDGTLWDEHMQVPKSTITAIHRLRENGNYAFICSGRSRASIRAKELLEDIGFDGIVAGCGTHIEYHDKIVFENILSQAEIDQVLSVLNKYNMPVIMEGKKCLYADKETFGEDPYVAYLENLLGGDFWDCGNEKQISGINKFSADYTRGDTEKLKQELSADYELIFHEKQVVEILPKGFSKATGIQWICDYLKVDHSDTYAFGDSVNDLEMLNYVKYGIAMGNATEDAKEAADYVTSSLKEDGIYHGLEHFGLI